MNAHELRRLFRRRNLTSMTIAAMFALAAGFGLASGTAQTAQDNQAPPGGEEREFENTIPAHVPVKVKLKNEQAFRNQLNKEWGRDLEIEVQNTGTKPIYYMYMIILFEDFLLEDGHKWGIQVGYGRKELWDLEEPILPDDVPLRPGETHTFKIPEARWKGFQAIRNQKNKADPKRIRFEMQFITFGDGTGLESTLGGPMLPPPKKRSRNEPPPEQGAGDCRPLPERRALGSPAKFLKASAFREPAEFLRVSFFPPESAARPAPAPDCNCRNVPNCFFGVIQQCAWQCPCDNPCNFPSHVSTGNCSTSTGRCRQVELTHQDCDTQFNGTQTCSFDRITNFACGVGDPPPPPPPSETPPPTPTPTPTPTPDCDPAARPNATNCFCRRDLPGVPPHWECLGASGSPASP